MAAKCDLDHVSTEDPLLSESFEAIRGSPPGVGGQGLPVAYIRHKLSAAATKSGDSSGLDVQSTT